jgi:S1-C subfamily serine protease
MGSLIFALLVLPASAKDKSTLTQPLAPSEVVEKVGTSIVRIDARFSYQVEGETSPRLLSSSGTGFIVDRQSRIATANHVVDTALHQRQVEAGLARERKSLVPGSLRLNVLSVAILLPNIQGGSYTSYGNTDVFGAKIVAQDALRDIAILSCNTNLITMRAVGMTDTRPRTLPEFRKDAPRQGDPVTIIGFPAIMMGEHPSQIPGATTNSGSVSNSFFMDELGRSVILLDLRANHGDSGGPAFDSRNGEIIGFVDEGYNGVDGQYSGLTSIVPIGQILSLIPR